MRDLLDRTEEEIQAHTELIREELERMWAEDRMLVLDVIRQLEIDLEGDLRGES